jgi:uncharacterized protein YndB with AHSA1/START domain
MRRLVRDALALAGFVVGMTGLADLILARLARAGAYDPTIRMSTEVDAPIEVVWEVVADVDRQPEWMEEMSELRMLTDPPLGVGSRGEATVTIAGFSTTDPVTVTEFAPPRRYAIAHEGRIRGDGLIALVSRAAGGPTIVAWEERLFPPVFPYVGGAVMRPVLRRIFQGDLERLAAMVAAERARAGREPAAAEPSAAEGAAAPLVAEAPPVAKSAVAEEAPPAPAPRKRRRDRAASTAAADGADGADGAPA